MCGRFAQLQAVPALSEKFGARESQQIALLLGDPDPRYNIAPTQLVLAVVQYTEKRRELVPLQWGLVPAWAKDTTGSAKLTNARAETVAELPSFRTAYRRRRCLIPASAFYEWRRSGRKRQPFAILRYDREPMAFAGLWEEWRPEGKPESEPLRTCTILTTAANALMEAVHPRMPVILAPDDQGVWLAPTANPDVLQGLLRPCPSEDLELFPVSQAVNNAQNQGAELLEPITLAAPIVTGTFDFSME